MFQIITGTICSDSPIQRWPKWFLAIHLDTCPSQGSSSLQLAQTIGVRQPTAGAMLQRIRPAAGTKASELLGVEVDETYIGGKEKNKHADKRTPGRQGRNTRTKAVAGGMQARDAKLIAVHVTGAKAPDILPHALEAGKLGARIHADELGSYSALADFYSLSRVNHGRGEYVRDKVHANSIKSVWALVKRVYMGMHHDWNIQYPQRDRNACTLRLHHQADAVDTRRTAWLAGGQAGGKRG